MRKVVFALFLCSLLGCFVPRVCAASDWLITDSGSGYKGFPKHYCRAKINYNRETVVPDYYLLEAEIYDGAKLLEGVSMHGFCLGWMSSTKTRYVETNSYWSANYGIYRVAGRAVKIKDNTYVYYDPWWQEG
ncbi:MAG: hypothetical protein IKZ90_05885 [Clostridiales bacterium]|nr:hypothetical protein [Clostridiales bacterium]